MNVVSVDLAYSYQDWKVQPGVVGHHHTLWKRQRRATLRPSAPSEPPGRCHCCAKPCAAMATLPLAPTKPRESQDLDACVNRGPAASGAAPSLGTSPAWQS